MTAGIFLIAAMLVLGGVLATAGDRIGMKVGKARLSLFNMRPRQTATVVTILTGSLISASTLGVLFLLSEQLRTGIFELEDIQTDLADAQTDFERAKAERTLITRELNQVTQERQEAEDALTTINESLDGAIAAQSEAEQQLTDTRTELTEANAKFQRTQSELQQVSEQANALRNDIQALQQQQQQQTDDLNLQRNALLEQDAQIFEKTQQLSELEIQRALLIDELRTLRAGDVALFRNQRLAVGVVSSTSLESAAQAVDQVVRRANRTVLQQILPGTQPIERQVVLITNADVEQLTRQLSDGREYVIRILSAGNYLVGEPCVAARQRCIQVTAEAVPNELVFRQQETIAATAIEQDIVTEAALLDRVELLVSATQFRARQAGIFADNLRIADGQDTTTRVFLEQLLADWTSHTTDDTTGSLNVLAIAARDIYTAGPLIIELVAERDGTVILSTMAVAAESNSQEDRSTPIDNGTDNPDVPTMPSTSDNSRRRNDTPNGAGGR